MAVYEWTVQRQKSCRHTSVETRNFNRGRLSTKGNVVLQFCGISERQVPAIAGANPDKFDCFTPGTGCQSDARAMRPDYFLPLPLKFKDGIWGREHEYLKAGGKFIFPFPESEMI